LSSPVSRSLTVLGSCGAWPEAGRACAGFLVEYDGFRVVLDLGYATLPRLLEHCPRGEVDAVVVTHQHPDHCVDVSGLARVRHYEAPTAPPVALHCAPGVLDVLRALEPNPDPAEVFDVHELASTTRIGPFDVLTVELPHYKTNLGVRLTAPGVSVAYTGDSGPSPDHRRLAEGTDLFIADATYQGESPDQFLMSAAEAAQAARGAQLLLLTHFWPGLDRSISIAEAEQFFAGKVLAADEGLTVTL
jgi:ribonuclease BN (tRNA processing enzyme)